MLSIQDHVSKATQDRVAAQLDTGATLTGTMMDGMQQFADLNLNLARATLEQSNVAARQLMSAEDSRQFLSMAAAQIQPSATRTFDYGYYLTTITADTQANVIRLVGGSIAETNREWIELAKRAGISAPFGWKATFSALREAVESAALLYGELVCATQSALRSLASGHGVGMGRCSRAYRP